jgi:DNA polymerase-3 subunit delta'
MIVGNKSKIDLLKKISQSENIPHALLFSGPEMIGKKKIAIEFIKSIFCKNVCNECYFCKAIDSNSLPDLNIIYPFEGNIGIEELRTLKNNLSLKSYNNCLKVGIIDDVHLMKKEAQNALLKTLEEPKGETLIILITSYPQLILKTIRSRLQEIKFSLASKKEIESHLISLGATKKKAEDIALISSGQVGKAIEFFNVPDKIEFFDRTIEDIISLIKSSMYERFEYAKNFKEDQNKILEVLDIWERFLRREMLLIIFKNQGILNNYTLEKTKEIIKKIEEAKILISSSNVNKKMALENLLISL